MSVDVTTWGAGLLALVGGLGLGTLLTGGGEEPLRATRRVASGSSAAPRSALTAAEDLEATLTAELTATPVEVEPAPSAVAEPVEPEPVARRRRGLEALRERSLGDPLEPLSAPAVVEAEAGPARPLPAAASGAATSVSKAPRGSAETRVVEGRVGARGRLEGQAAEAREGDGLRLEASFTRAGSELVVRYRVTNQGAGPAYVFTPLERYDFSAQAWEPAPERVYARKLPRRTLELTKRLVQVPKGARVFKPEVPTLTRLAPGATLVETLRLPTPVALDDPYAGARSRRARPGTAKAVIFSIGYLRDVPAGHLIRLSGDPERYEVSYGVARSGQKILRSGRVALTVPVK